MIRMKRAALGLAASILATGVLAQAGFSQDSISATVADELFGSSSVKLEFAGFPEEPKAKLLFTGTMLEQTTEFSVTYTFSNATLAENAEVGDVMWGVWRPTAVAADDATTTGIDESCYSLTELEFTELADEVVVERNADNRGSIGANSVTYDFEIDMVADLAADPVTFAAGNIVGLSDPSGWTKSATRNCDHDADNATPAIDIMHYPAGTMTRKIVLNVPDLNASGLRAPNPMVATDMGNSVRVSSRIEQDSSRGTELSEMIVNGTMCGEVAVARTGTGSCVVVDSAAVVVLSSAAGTGGSISLKPEDMRAKLVVAPNAPQRAHLASVTTSVTEGALNQMGSVASIE
ncbi:MAG: hypothetical protein OXQ29_01690, partial [Rhodospirillaceae bacterium]|nr:hypothetical protein [Rhodospirillaceae bacterium]